jgi:hypothetical protein
MAKAKVKLIISLLTSLAHLCPAYEEVFKTFGMKESWGLMSKDWRWLVHGCGIATSWLTTYRRIYGT